MKLTFNSKRLTVEKNMSESNIGGRQNNGCRNLIWVMNAIIHEQLKSVLNIPLMIQQYDYTQMFDGMNLKESFADLYDGGIKDNNLQLLYAANRKIHFRVRTPTCMTEEQNLEQVVVQGDTCASASASVQCDNFGKQLLEDKQIFTIWS